MQLDSVMGQLETAQLVQHLGEEELAYLFKHTLTRDAAYQSLLQKQRREIHRHVAQAYESLYPDRLEENSTLLAQHYAEARDDAKTVEYSIKAAEAAARLFAFPEASGHFARALEALKRLPDTEEHRRRRVDAIFRYTGVGWGTLVPHDLFSLVLEAEALAGSLRNPDGTLGDPLRLAQIHTSIAGVHLAGNAYREAIRYARHALDEASALDDKTIAATPSSQLGLALGLQGHFADAVPHLVQAMNLLEQTPDRWEWFSAVGFLSVSLAMRGQIAEGWAEVQSALARMEANQNGFGITVCCSLLLAVSLERADLSQLFEASRRAVEAATQSGHNLYVYIGLGFQALASSRLGKHSEARATMAEAHAVSAKLGGQLMLSDWIAAANAEIAYNAGRMQEAIAFAEQTIAMAQSLGGIFAEGWAQRVWAQALAKLGPSCEDQAEQHFAESLSLFEAGDARLEAARTHLAWGKFLRECGDTNSARKHWDQAAAQFEASGLRADWKGRNT